MNTHIDWMSFSVDFGTTGYPELGWNAGDILQFIRTFVGPKVESLFDGADATITSGRKPYAHGLLLSDTFLRVYWSGRLTHCLVECSGTASEALRERGLERDYLAAIAPRITRLDLATDFHTSITPAEFANKRGSKSQLAHAHMVSKTGETEYIGGRTSAKFARVYRYNAPHPRHEYLRIEHETKRDFAKECAKRVLVDGVVAVQAEIGRAFQWEHELWSALRLAPNPIKLPPHERSFAKTEIWLRTQAAAGFKKLVARGLITDPEAWLREVFLDSP